MHALAVRRLGVQRLRCWESSWEGAAAEYKRSVEANATSHLSPHLTHTHFLYPQILFARPHRIPTSLISETYDSMGDWLPEMPATPSDDDPALHSPTLTPYSWLGANDDGFLVPLFQAQMETSPGNSLLAADASSVKGGRRELSFAGMQYTISSDGDDSDSQLSTISVAPRRKLTDSGPRSRKRPRRAAKAAAAAKFNAHFALTGNQSTRQQVLPSSSLPSTPVPPLSPSSPDRRLQQLLDHSLRRPSSDLRATRQSEPSIMPAQTSSSTPAKRPYRTRRKAATTTKKPTAATKPMVTSSSAEPTTTVKPFVTSSGGKPTTEDEKYLLPHPSSATTSLTTHSHTGSCVPFAAHLRPSTHSSAATPASKSTSRPTPTSTRSASRRPTGRPSPPTSSPRTSELRSCTGAC